MAKTSPAKRAKRSAGTKLIAVGGRAPRKQPEGKGAFTKKKQTLFLTVLSETCNVAQACREADVSSAHVYRRRKSDAAFRTAWREAIAVAYQRLELELLDRAFNGIDKLLKHKDGSEERVKEYSNEFGLRLLKLHRDSAVEADTDYEPADVEELRERLIKKLERLVEREGAKDATSE